MSITHKRADVLPAAHNPAPDAGMTPQSGGCPQLFVLLPFQDSACKTLVRERLLSLSCSVWRHLLLWAETALLAQGHGELDSDLTALQHKH